MSPERRNLWLWALVATVVVLYQVAIPPFSDEAYLLSWGLEPALGYYDHPPLTGWVSWVLLWLDSHLGINDPIKAGRVFALALGGISAWLLYRRLELLAPDGGAGVFLAVWALIPGTIMFFSVYVNDLLVVFLVIVFVLTLHRLWLWQEFSPGLIVLAALALAGMLLTKYSSAIFYLAVLAGLSWDRDGRRFIMRRLLPVTLLAAIPFLWHLWWNLNNCSVNLAFNFSFRDENPTGGAAVSLLATLFLSTGVIFWQFLWNLGRGRLLRIGFFSRLFLAVLALSAVIALVRGNFGGNWAAPFSALAVLALAESRAVLSRWTALRSQVAMTLILVIPTLLATLAMKTGVVSAKKYLPEAAAYRFFLLQDLGNSDELAESLRRLAMGRVLASDKYGLSALFKLDSIGPAVTLSDSVYGRNDDLFTDYSALDGRDFLLLFMDPQKGKEVARRFFGAWRMVQIEGSRSDYTVFLADDFDFPAFRNEILIPFIRGYYMNAPFPYRSCTVTRYLDLASDTG